MTPYAGGSLAHGTSDAEPTIRAFSPSGSGLMHLFGADIAPLRRSDSSSLRRIFQPPEANLSLVRES